MISSLLSDLAQHFVMNEHQVKLWKKDHTTMHVLALLTCTRDRDHLASRILFQR